MCEQVEERLQFYETGVATRTNEEVMREAVGEYKSSIAKQKKNKKKKKQKKQEESTEMEQFEELDKENDPVEPSESAPVVKKRGKKEISQVYGSEVELPETTKRKKQLRTT